MKTKKLLINLTSTTLVSLGLVGMTDVALHANVNAPQTVYAATTSKKLKSTAAIYNYRGRKTRKTIKKGKSVKVYGTKTIKHKKYYRIGKNKYILTSHVVSSKKTRSLRKLSLREAKYQFRLNTNHAVYDANGKRLNVSTIKKGTLVNAKAVTTINGQKFADLGYGQFMKIADTKTMMWQGDGNEGNTSTNTKPDSSKTTVTPNKGNNSSSDISKDSSKQPTKDGGVKGKDYVMANYDRNYLTNNVEHVKQLLMDRINQERVKHIWYSHPELNEHLKPYLSDPEIQRLADIRVEETAKTGNMFAHTRPNGHYMDMQEFRTELPDLGQKFKLGRFSAAGENLLQCNAQETDEESADEIFRLWFTEPAHKVTLISEDARVGYAAVSLSFSPKDGYYASFEMVGSNYLKDEQ